MLIESYPVGWAVDAGKAESVLAYLIDLPGIAMQGRTFADAITKLRAVAPEALATLRRDGAVLPSPSAEPSLRIGAIQWLRARRREPVGDSDLELASDVQLAPT